MVPYCPHCQQFRFIKFSSAFSGAEEFLEKYKNSANAIIGHFGLGFYSAFMVSKKVEIRSLSYKEGAKAVCWTCDGSPEYEMNVGCMMPWMDYTPRTLDEIIEAWKIRYEARAM